MERVSLILALFSYPEFTVFPVTLTELQANELAKQQAKELAEQQQKVLVAEQAAREMQKLEKLEMERNRRLNHQKWLDETRQKQELWNKRLREQENL
jgi:ribosomal protein L3